MSEIKETARAKATRAKRQQIVDAAMACFIEKGFHQSSMRTIASAAGVSLGNLYNHFENKDALIAEIAALEAAEFSEYLKILEDEPDALSAIQKLGDVYVESTSSAEGVALTVEITAEVVRNPAIASGFAANRIRLVRAISSRLDSAKTLNQVAQEVDSEEAAQFILDVWEGVAFRIAVLDKPRADRAIASATHLIERCLRL
ncbi:MAG: TetR/AcrR family transcriptional regulator [Pseudomonadota bacterium]